MELQETKQGFKILQEKKSNNKNINTTVVWFLEPLMFGADYPYALPFLPDFKMDMLCVHCQNTLHYTLSS